MRTGPTGSSWLVAGTLVSMVLALGLAASPAVARDGYVANYTSADVTAFDTATNAVVATIPVGNNPAAIAITPDGKRAYVANAGDGTVSVIDTATNQVVGDPIPAGTNTIGIAVTPNGKKVLAGNNVGNTITVINTKNHKVKPEVPVSGAAALYGLAISPTGDRAYAMSYSTDQIMPINANTAATDGSPIGVGQNPSYMAFTPDTGIGYVANSIDGTVSVISAAGAVSGPPITVGADPQGVAITPSGERAYVSSNTNTGKVYVINTATNTLVGSPIGVGDHPRGLAVDPSGTRAYVANSGVSGTPGTTVSVINTATNTVVGSPITVGSAPRAIAIVPDQPPEARLLVTHQGDPGTDTTFEAGTSTDSDGTIIRYDWNFGDGELAPDAGPVPAHTYMTPGNYDASVTLTDNEGCSTTVTYTGQTASCGGSDAAIGSKTLKIANPRVKVKCKRNSKGSCRIKLAAITSKHGGTLESAVARAKLKPGRSKKVPLVIAPTYAASFGFQTETLVREQIKTKGRKRTIYKKVKVIR